MFLLPAFVVVPNSDDDWATNWETTQRVLNAAGGVVIWLGLVIGACALVAKVRLRKARPATATLPERPAITIGTAFGAVIKYFIGPFTRFWVGLNREAVAPMFDVLRAENTEQHAETAARLGAVEDAVIKLSARMDIVEKMVDPNGVLVTLEGKLDELAETVRRDRHATRNTLSALNGSVELLTDMLRDRQAVKGDHPG